ncbi:MAG: SDR family NAD(P)-dependent oxidoreductase [Rhodococcus sp. (in: high G+C Gram-positive bacteria)]|uniref:SDR family NAD(P)-dependent oxidoreductase n=1 Tax=Rhodococcus sp. TaxID=1831 RepID=UPI002AD8DD2B|nr:SDR family NAD(P)-dependent oxidoreductase [Rhodococcus sp. (in: high G+C Gram-positive bacteria)]
MNRAHNDKHYNAKVAVVTGAGSGLGRSLAQQLGHAGATLALCDVDPGGLEETARLCRAAGIDPLCAVVDVTDRAALTRFADQVQARFTHVDYLINNAGVGFVGTFEASDLSDVERVMNVDFWGVLNTTKAFLPLIVAAEHGHIVNISSILGLFALPSQGAYTAAKFAVRGFTEALRQEMIAGGHPVVVSCVHPGFVRTEIARRATAANGHVDARAVELVDRYAMTSADTAARTILRGARYGRAKILVGPDAYLADLATRILGSWYQRPLAHGFARLFPGWFARP